VQTKTIAKGKTVLVIEDELEVRGLMEISLKSLGYLVEFAEDGPEALNVLRTRASAIHAVLLDTMISQDGGLEVITEIRRGDPDVPVIVLSGTGQTPSQVIQAMKCGATDFLCKPVGHDVLSRALDAAISTRDSNTRKEPQPVVQQTGAYFGNSVKMLELQGILGNVGWCETPVLIQGETGSGKEVLARELHAQSPRANKIFLKLNCAALPSELVESELFGYEKGAFTGAFQKKLGMFEVADGGTILLDEIGDMDFRLQAKLLQVLQDQEFQRIGGKETVRVNVRVIAATHRDLEKAILENVFREDLYYRLSVINLHLPPLRERKDDILPLAECLWKRNSGVGAFPLTADLRHVFMTYEWPGNVRELDNAVRRLIVFRDPTLVANDLLARAARSRHAEARRQTPTAAAPVVSAPHAPTAPRVLEDVTRAQKNAEIEAILAALNATRWNRKKAALLLKVDYKALLYKMAKLGIEDRVVPMSAHGATDEKAKGVATGTA